MHNVMVYSATQIKGTVIGWQSPVTSIYLTVQLRGLFIDRVTRVMMRRSHHCSAIVARRSTNGQVVQFSAMDTAVASTASRKSRRSGIRSRWSSRMLQICCGAEKQDVLAMYIFMESRIPGGCQSDIRVVSDAKSCSTRSGNVGTWCQWCDNAYSRVLSSPC